MQQTITIKGSNPIDLNSRKAAIEKINQLSTQELKSISSLVDNENARMYLKDEKMFESLTSFL